MRSNRFPGRARSVAAAVIFACAGSAGANPQGASVAAGTATFQTAGKTLTVTNAPGTIINWNSFSIGSGETTRFLQQSASSAVLNRVTGNDPSSLLGTLSSNGRVFLINPHGIIVGAGARIDTAGFIASTLNMTDADFINNRLKFEGGGLGVVRNEGTIRASGDIMLVGPRVENAGLIKSDNGSVLLAAGQKLTITSPDAQGVKFELQAPSDTALNVGTIEARNAVGMFAGTLRHSGDIRAGVASLDDGGRVILAALGDAIVDKNATITASGTHGGVVHILGERVGITDFASVDASGEKGGGTILVGGDFQGKNPLVQHASQTFLGPDVRLRADATTDGDGGKVVIWSDRATEYYGNISARGGAQSGNGGLVEVSSKGYLDFRGAVDTRAPHGQSGTLLLDPADISIVADDGTGTSMPPGPLFSNVGSSIAASKIFVPILASSLQSNDVTISTASNAVGPQGNITFVDGFTFTPIQPVTPTLTLIAANNVNVNAPIVADGTSGGGLSIKSLTGGATNISANMQLGTGGFDAASGGSGIVNFTPVPVSATIKFGNVDVSGPFSAKTINAKGSVDLGAPQVNTDTLNVGGGTFRLFGGLSAANLRVAGGATLDISQTGTGLALGQGGTLSGTGTVSLGAGGTLTNSGTLDLTANAGSPLTIFGGYFQGADGLMKVSVANPFAGPALIVSGEATLGGTLSVSTAPGFAAPVGSTFNVISGGIVPNTSFATINVPAAPNFIPLTPPVPGNFVLVQTTAAPVLQLPLALPPGNATTVNSLLALNNNTFLLITPQGIQIGGNAGSIGACQ